MITFLILWALADKQDETNRLLRMTPAELARENTERRAGEQLEIRSLLVLIALGALAILIKVLFFYYV